MKKKARLDTFMQCPDPNIAKHLKQGDVVRVEKTYKGQPIKVDFIVQFFQLTDEHNGNHHVCVFTQQLNKVLGKPKSFQLHETLIFNDQNMGLYSFCTLAYKRWNMARVIHRALTDT